MGQDLQSIRSAELQMGTGLSHYPDLVFALEYWRAKKGNRLAPTRSEIDPVEIKQLLPRIMLATVTRRGEEPPEFQYRLSGTGICNIHGQEMTGQGPLDLQPQEFGELVHAHYLEALDRKTPMAHAIALQSGDKSGAYARIILPLSNDGKLVDMLLIVDSEKQNSLQEFLQVIEATGKRTGTEI